VSKSVGCGYVRTSKKGDDYMVFFIGEAKYVAFFSKDKKKDTDPDFSIQVDEGKQGAK
jgi:hypothetical protein